MKEINYQKIYDKIEWYGNAKKNRCPGVTLMHLYLHWLDKKVFDYGCGRGHTVSKLRENKYTAYGYDIIENNNRHCFNSFNHLIGKRDRDNMTFLCIDVLEHLIYKDIKKVLVLAGYFNRSVISVNNKSSLCPLTGKELHLTLQPFDWWENELSEYVTIIKSIKVHDNQILYLSKRK